MFNINFSLTNSAYCFKAAEAIHTAADMQNGVYTLKELDNLQGFKELGFNTVTLDDLAAAETFISKIYHLLACDARDKNLLFLAELRELWVNN